MTNAVPEKNARDLAIEQIRSALKCRTGRAWSVREGRGTSWGWITISAPPARIVSGRHSDEDTRTLAEIFDEPENHLRSAGGFVISPQERRDVVRRAMFDRIANFSMHTANDNS